MANYVHLHLHSEYSLLDGLNRTSDIVENAKSLGMNSVALTDHGVMYGAFEFWSKCKEAEIKPIIGVEAYIANRTRFDKVPKVDDKRYHVVLLAKNFEGYQNLMKMVSLSHTEGFYYKPRIDRELIERYGKGLIGTSACMGGVINVQLRQGQEKEAKDWAKFLDKHLDSFYIELQRNGIKESEDLIPHQMKLAKRLKLQVVAGCDAHYAKKEDWYAQEILWAISDGKKMDDDTRRTAKSKEFYIKNTEEMMKLFKDIPEAISNTQSIADQVETYNVTFDRIQPIYQNIPKGKNTKEVLESESLKGAKKRYGTVTKEIKTRIENELEIIHDKGYDDYFLVVADYVNWAIDKGILIGPGRGSGGGSVVAYCLNIINIDPFQFDLYFERFLNPERESPPDFDIDFQDDRRDELFEYMSDVYGKENTAFIGTFGRMKTRSAIRDVARVLDIDLEVADKLSKMVDVKFGRVAHMQDMINKKDEFRSIINSDIQLKKLSEIVQKIEGIARHVSTHACGYLVTPDEIVNYVPVQKETRGGTRTITQIEGYSLEYIGLMKFDFLGLTNLTIIQNALKLVAETNGVDIDIYDIALDDKKTYRLFQKGETTAVFQFESDGMKKYLIKLKPSAFEDLIFMAAAYRPGPMQYIPDYIDRKFGKQKVTYLHKNLEPILANTYGFAIYQEQVLRIAVDMAGYTLGAADILRRAMGKKKPEIMKIEKEKFIKGCMDQGYTKKLAQDLFAYIEPFADYGFNRSHAAAYALIAYQTAYLKAHYPVEFMAGLMQTDLEVSEKISRDVLEAERMGITVLPPHINKSNVDFSLEGEKSIRFGLGAVKNVGRKEVGSIIKERDKNESFEHIDDLVNRVGASKVSKKTLEFLIKAGALDQFGKRKALLEIMPGIIDTMNKVEKKKLGGQSGLFDSSDTSAQIQPTPLPQVEESEIENLEWESELVGTFLSSHPLKKYQKFFGEEIMTVRDAKKVGENQDVRVGGFISDQREIITRKGGRTMAFIKIQCFEDSIEGVVFDGIYEKHRERISLHKPFVFLGKTSNRDGKISLIIDDFQKFNQYQPSITKGSKTLTIDISNEADPIKLEILKQTIVDNPGDYKLVIYYADSKGKKQKKDIKRKIRLSLNVKRVLEEYIVVEKEENN